MVGKERLLDWIRPGMMGACFCPVDHPCSSGCYSEQAYKEEAGNVKEGNHSLGFGGSMIIGNYGDKYINGLYAPYFS